MTARGRWAAVAVGVLALLAAPFVLRAWPVASSSLSAPEVVARIRASQDVPYSGLVSSRGGVSLPGDAALEGVATLLGRDGDLRAWWAGPDTWRVATLRTTGETDLWHRGEVTMRWVYESRNLTVHPDAPVRLPTSVDVLPPVLAVRVLQGAHEDEVTRLPTARVAGRTAVGVRLTPDQPQSTVGHVDLWADTETGLPLRVEVHGSQGPAVLAAGFTSLDLGMPSPDDLRFTPPPDARVDDDEAVDLATAANRYADREVPDTLAGLPSRGPPLGSVGLFGRGPTVLLAVPVRAEDAEDLRRELQDRPGSTCLELGDVVATGPITTMLTRRGFGDDWLLIGTVTADSLERAAGELPAASRAIVPDWLREESVCP